MDGTTPQIGNPVTVNSEPLPPLAPQTSATVSMGNNSTFVYIGLGIGLIIISGIVAFYYRKKKVKTNGNGKQHELEPLKKEGMNSDII